MSLIRKRKPNECKECPFYKRPPVWGSGSDAAPLLLVGDYPRREEVIAGEPFSGFAKDLLDRIFKEVDLVREDIHFTYAVKCQPPDNVKSNSKPMNEAIVHCRPLIQKEIENLGPSVIVLGGEVPLRAVMDVKKIGTYRGVFYDHSSGAKIIPTNSLVSVLHAPKNTQAIRSDLEQASLRLDGASPVYSETKVVVLKTLRDIERQFNIFKKKKYISIDCETTDWDPDTKKVAHKDGAVLYTTYEPLCFQFSCKEGEGIILPIEGFEREELWSTKDRLRVKKMLLDLFKTESITWCVQDVMMDLRVLYKFLDGKLKVWDLKFFDTLAAKRIINENGPADLDAQAAEYTTMGPYKQLIEKKYRGKI